MQILLIGLAAVALVVFASRFFDRKQSEMLKQYETLEKRFGLQRRVFKSKWGKGIGERHTIEGEFHGYPISLYSHYHDSDGKRVIWTSLVFELLFAGDFECDFELGNVPKPARFPRHEFVSVQEVAPKVLLLSNRYESELAGLVTARTHDRLEQLARQERAGAIRLSKGFLEYREIGDLDNDAMRIRFQDALLLMADLADGIAEVARRSKALSSGENP